jgi:hypothetical protein
MFLKEKSVIVSLSYVNWFVKEKLFSENSTALNKVWLG